jgi:hypothetical protein
LDSPVALFFVTFSRLALLQQRLILFNEVRLSRWLIRGDSQLLDKQDAWKSGYLNHVWSDDKLFNSFALCNATTGGMEIVQSPDDDEQTFFSPASLLGAYELSRLFVFSRDFSDQECKN